MNNPTAQRHRFFQSLARIAVLLAICLAPYRGIAANSESPAASVPAALFTRIVYSDSGGFTGEGTGKWLSIDGDGKLQLKKRKGGEAKGQLSDQELTDLGRDVAAVDWSTVEKHYRSRRAGMIQNDLVVTIGGTTQGTHAVVGSAEIPPALKNLFSRLPGRPLATPRKPQQALIGTHKATYPPPGARLPPALHRTPLTQGRPGNRRGRPEAKAIRKRAGRSAGCRR